MPSKIQVSEIDSMLNSLAKKDPGWDQPQWSQAVKRGLVDLAKAYGWEAHASQCDNPDRPEWLYDVTWLQRTGGIIADSPLVAEIEWLHDGREIMKDFQKLLLARAEVRLMVFEASNPTRARELTDELIAQARAYSRTEPGDRYILACLDNPRSDVEPYNFQCREYVHPEGRRARA